MKHINLFESFALNEALSTGVLNLILSGLRATGNNKDSLFYIEEQLTPAQAKEVDAFLGWLEETGKTIGSGNVTSVYAEFKKSVPANEFEKHFVSNKTTKQETARIEREKSDKIFKTGDEIYVQKQVTSSFSVRHKVISTDPTKNTVTIQLSDPYKSL